MRPSDTVLCSNDAEGNYKILKKLMRQKNRPDGIIASVEKLTTSIYLACKELKLSIPGHVKVVSFTNLQTALILDPPLSTITPLHLLRLLYPSFNNLNFDRYE